MNSNVIEKVLIDSDIDQLLDIINVVDFDSDNMSYINPHINKGIFSDLVIREEFFNYSIFAYGRYVNNELSKIAYYHLPTTGNRSKSLELHLLGERDESDMKQFLLNSITELRRQFTDFCKIKVFICKGSENNRLLIDTLTEIGFIKEILLKDEIEVGKDVEVYSYFY